MFTYSHVSCKMVLWPIRARVLFELFYKHQYKIVPERNDQVQVGVTIR